jgi:hypothetical protein
LPGAVQPRQRNQRQRVAAGLRAVFGDRLGARRAGLAGRDPQVDDLLLAEQRQARARMQQLAPVEAALGEEHLALSVPGLARRRANRVGGLERQQGLVAVNDVKRRERFREVGLELLGAQLHAGLSRSPAASPPRA